MTDRLAGVTLAVLGFGNQGEAQALNLRDSGATVIVGAREGGAGCARARDRGFETHSIAEAARRASLCSVLLPDEVVPDVWPEIVSGLRPGAGMVFAHGFAVVYGGLTFPRGVDVVLVSPTGPGRVLRELYRQGGGLPAYLAVHQDASGHAWELAESYARAIGSDRAGLLRTTVREETEVDLFGEQAVLCGGMSAIVTAAWETLVAKGYSPEIAYLECVHQLKYLADLVHEAGVAGMYARISRTALYGAVTRGPRVAGEAARAAMAGLLEEIRSGAFAREFTAEFDRGEPRLSRALAEAQSHPMERARERALRGGHERPGGKIAQDLV